MPHYNEERAYDTELQTAPPTANPDKRPPQLNETICGCSCGCGCNGDLGGEGIDQGGSVHTNDTLVEVSDDEEEEFPPSSDGPEQHAQDTFSIQRTQSWHQATLSEIRHRFGNQLHDAQGFQLNEHHRHLDVPAFRLPRAAFLLHDYDDMGCSVKNHPGSDDHSVISSDARSVRCISPGPGLGSWIERWEGDAGLKEYPGHFSSRPLRLTPQRQFCRGLVASHLVLIEDGVAVDAAEGFFRN